MSKTYLMRAVGFANGVPCPHAGEWLASFDHEADNGRGFGTFTVHAGNARRFRTRGEAFTFWRKRSKVRPTRPDGQPNRPLTALSISVEPMP